MILILGFVLSTTLCLVSYIQLLYLESMRLRTRECESLEYFKSELEDALGYDTEPGAVVFSLLKHTLLVFSGAAFVGAAATQGEGWRGLLEGFLLGWGVMLGAAYIVPQLLYRRSSGHWALPLVPFLRFLAVLFRPLTILLGFFQSLSELSEPGAEQEQQKPGEEIDALISAGEEEGIIEKEDSKLIQNVVAFGDKRVREVMTPRPSVVAINVSSSLEDLGRLAKNEQYSRIPVYEGIIDRVAGFVHVRDYYELDDKQRKSKTIRDLMRPIEAVPESMLVSELLRGMQRRSIHVVAVVDEYGNLAGLATLEDLVEEVFGEIRDEHEPQHDVVNCEDGSIIVSGSFDLDNLEEHFGFRPANGIESTTAGGLATEWFGAVPKPGEVIVQEGLRMEILESDDFRVEKLKIGAAPPESPEMEVELS